MNAVNRAVFGSVKARSTFWAVLATAMGISAGVLPVPLVLAGVGGIGLLVFGLAQPVTLFVITLITSPLKALLDTERPGLPGIGQLGFALTLGIWLINRIASRRKLLVWSPLFWPLIATLLASSLSLFVAISPETTISELIKWAEILLMAVLACTMSVERGWLWPVFGILATASTQAVIGIYQFFGGSGSPSLWILDNHYFRAFGTFGQPNPFGACLGLILPVTLGLIWGHLTRQTTADAKRVMALIAVALLLAGGLIASWSRGAWLGAVAAIAIMIIFAPRRRWIGLTIAVAAITVGGLALASGLVPASLASRLGDFTSEISGFQDVRGVVVTDANYAVIERLAHWEAGLAMADANPWLGVGFGDYEAAYPQYRLLNWPIALGHAHNYYINMAAETGIIGAGVYILAWLAIFVLNIVLLGRLSGIDRGLALGLLGTWTYLSVHSLFDKLYVNNLFLHVGAMVGILGGLWIMAQNQSANNRLSAAHQSIELMESTGKYGSNSIATNDNT